MRENKMKQYSLELNSVKKQLPSKCFFFIFFTHTYNTNKNLSGAKSIQNKNLCNLALGNSNLISETLLDPEKVFFNCSSHELSDYEKLPLRKGLKFSIPPKHLDYADHMMTFELLFREINKIEMPN